MTTRSSRVLLIVEHDELLKSLTADTLEDAGFAAFLAGHAGEALGILETRPDIALMLTSVMMPGSMDGLGLARTVRKRWPAVKTIITSGQVRLIGSDLTAGSRFLLKPYRAQTMISEIRSLIGGSRSGSWDSYSCKRAKSVQFCSDSLPEKTLN